MQAIYEKSRVLFLFMNHQPGYPYLRAFRNRYENRLVFARPLRQNNRKGTPYSCWNINYSFCYCGKANWRIWNWCRQTFQFRWGRNDAWSRADKRFCVEATHGKLRYSLLSLPFFLRITLNYRNERFKLLWMIWKAPICREMRPYILLDGYPGRHSSQWKTPMLFAYQCHPRY